MYYLLNRQSAYIKFILKVRFICELVQKHKTMKVNNLEVMNQTSNPLINE